MKLVALVALFIGSVAWAQERNAAAPSPPTSPLSDPTEAPAPPRAVAPNPPERSSLHGGRRFGLQLDAGAPGGATLALVARPWRFLRVNGGMAWNYFGFGVKGGVTLAPFRWGIAPTLGVEGGHLFQADASRLGNGATAKRLLGSIGYSYVSGDVGLELGPQDRFLFFVRGGISYLSGPVKNVAEAIQAGSGGEVVVKSAGEATASYFGPSAKVGVVFFLY